jgi:hypothetical protein
MAEQSGERNIMIKRTSSTVLASVLELVIGFAPSSQLMAQTAASPAGGVPAQLQAPPPAASLLRANAEGAQIYNCAAKPGSAGFEWTLKAPDAVLMDASGKPAIKHFAGPTWQANDGSKVVGEIAARADAPGGQAIPWLLLKAKSHEGTGEFAAVTYIQRIDTKGGLAPTAGCDAAHVGQEQKVPYTAVYVFYK